MSTTPYLEIEDQANGSNNNSWGDVADANYQILELAIARSLSLATTGGTTVLTSSQNRYPIIVITGALSSNATIQVRTANKNWRFLNTTSGNYTITVKTLAGTGKTLPRGQTVDLYCDGTNVEHLRRLATPAAQATGSADAITATFEPPLTSDELIDGFLVVVEAKNANTATNPTFSPDGLGPYTIKKDGGQAIAVGDIARTGQKLLLCYDRSSTTWELLTPANAASTTAAGAVRLATVAETKTGTADDIAVTPEGLAAISSEGSNIASAATITIGDGRHFALTGNTTVTAISITDDAAGREFTLRVTANAVLQNNANVLSPTGADLQGHAGMLVTCKSDGSGVVRIIDVQTSPGNSRAPDVIVEDQKASGTDGGTFTSGADRTRDLNTLVRNAASIASLASSKVTLPRGNWYIEFEAPAFGVDAHQAILYNVTGTAELARGSSEYSNNGTTVTTTSRGSAFVTLAANSDLEIRHRCTSTKASQGLGRAGSFGTEVYSRLKAWRCP